MLVSFARMRTFWDVNKVQRQISKKLRRALYGTGAYVRKTMRNSMRRVNKRRKDTSPVNEPPFSRIGTLRNSIGFDVNMATKSVIIGPELYRSKYVVSREGLTGIQLLERGGNATFLKTTNRPEFAANIGPRPFVGPQEELAQQTFRNILARDGLT